MLLNAQESVGSCALGRLHGGSRSIKDKLILGGIDLIVSPLLLETALIVVADGLAS